MEKILIASLISCAAAGLLPSRQNFGRSLQQQGYQQSSRSNAAGRTGIDINKDATVLKFDQGFEDDGFHYSFDTSNSISAQESRSGNELQGSYSYVGDDGATYRVTFTSGVNGFQASGEHLPTPPPVPLEIQQALERNAADEAAGIMDDGLYRENPRSYDQGKSAQHQHNQRNSKSYGFSSSTRTQGSSNFQAKHGYRH